VATPNARWGLEAVACMRKLRAPLWGPTLSSATA